MKIFANLKLTKILQAQAWKARPPPLLFLMCFWKSLKSSSIVPILPVLPSFSNETPGEGAEAVDAFPRTQPAPCTCSLQQFCLCIFPAKEDPSLSLSSYILLLLWKKKKSETVAILGECGTLFQRFYVALLLPSILLENGEKIQSNY